jgi:hypothetical protein
MTMLPYRRISLILLTSLAAAAQTTAPSLKLGTTIAPMPEGTFSKPIPTPVTPSPIQHVRVNFEDPEVDANGFCSFRSLNVWFEDGYGRGDFQIPAGKTLVLTHVGGQILVPANGIQPGRFELFIGGLVSHSITGRAEPGEQDVFFHQSTPGGIPINYFDQHPRNNLKPRLMIIRALSHRYTPEELDGCQIFAEGYLRDSE